MLYLSHVDLENVLDLDRAIAITNDLYSQFARGSAIRMAPQVFEGASNSLRIAGGDISESGGLGVRLSISGGQGAVAILFGTDSGELLALMDYPFSTLRTAGLVGLATREFAPPTASVMAMVGTGKNAAGYCEAACHVRPIESIRVYSRDPQRRTEFARRIEDLTHVEVVAVESVDLAVSEADIVCVSTSSRDPVLDAEHLAPGTFVVSMGRSRELDASIFLEADDIITSYKPDISAGERHMDDDGQLIELVRSGAIDWSSQVHDLGSVLIGERVMSKSSGGWTVFRDFQTGFGDIALSLAAYHECVARGIGTSIGQ